MTETKNKIVILTGIPGSGKTTLLGSTLELLESRKVKYSTINYGTEMFDVAKEEGLVKNRDELRTLDAEKQKKIQRMVGMKIAAVAAKINVVVDTHCTIKTPAGYLPGLPEWVLKEINPNIIVLVESPAAEILKRRAADDTRIRDKDTEYEINEHQAINRATSMAYCAMTGATTKILKNYNDKLHESVNDLAGVMR